MTVGRIGDKVYDPLLERCEGCAQSTLNCLVCLDHDQAPCCGVCTHLHPLETLKLYGLLTR